MKAPPSLASMFRNDHPRAVDRYIDYFGGSAPPCRVGDRFTPVSEVPPALAGDNPARRIEASSA